MAAAAVKDASWPLEVACKRRSHEQSDGSLPSSAIVMRQRNPEPRRQSVCARGSERGQTVGRVEVWVETAHTGSSISTSLPRELALGGRGDVRHRHHRQLVGLGSATADKMALMT